MHSSRTPRQVSASAPMLLKRIVASRILQASAEMALLGSSLNASDPGSHVSCSHILGLKSSNFMLHLSVVWFLKEQLFDRSASCGS